MAEAIPEILAALGGTAAAGAGAAGAEAAGAGAAGLGSAAGKGAADLGSASGAGAAGLGGAAADAGASLPMFAMTSEPVAGAAGGSFLQGAPALGGDLAVPGGGIGFGAGGGGSGINLSNLNIPAGLGGGSTGDSGGKSWTQKAADALLKLGEAAKGADAHNLAPVQARLDLSPRSAQSQAFRGQSSLGSLVQALLQRQAQYGPPGSGGGGGRGLLGM
jgi:hypothetical protein